MCGAFFCARISTRTPAIFLPAMTTSFGNFTVAWRANSVEIVSATVLAAHSANCADAPMSIFGRSKIENQSPLPAADSHELLRWPRPAAWRSANTTRPSAVDGKVRSKTESLVDVVSSTTTRSRPMIAESRSARSFSALSASNVVMQ
jgi:hypothetical protein